MSNRIIKFNAWNKVNSAMNYDITSKENWSFSFLNQDVFIWLQFTGLFDKNKKEIYEGDIVEAKYAGGDGTVYQNTVVWNECGFYFANSPMWTWEEFEIKGNIYETQKAKSSK